MLKYIIVYILLFVSLSANETSKKVVFELTSGNIEAFEKKVLSGIAFHKTYYESNLQELEVSVVIHGDAYKFFLEDLSVSRYKNDAGLIKKHDTFAKRIKSLADLYEVEFLMCASGVNRLKINKKNIYPYVTLVATSTVGLIEKQSVGYSYVPIFK
ncbi:MAG: intracellular sulfur oxidation DsrE/DsrF family protein [Sulfurimonas sp.]|uniref:DsrE family protein n=1 Tax=Sulfurimonas sp. TaxID=2022749 RepID=UPI0039E5FF48